MFAQIIIQSQRCTIHSLNFHQLKCKDSHLFSTCHNQVSHSVIHYAVCVHKIYFNNSFFANIFAGKKRVAHLLLSAKLETKKRHTLSSSIQKSRFNQCQSRYQTLDTKISKLLQNLQLPRSMDSNLWNERLSSLIWQHRVQ